MRETESDKWTGVHQHISFMETLEWKMSLMFLVAILEISFRWQIQNWTPALLLIFSANCSPSLTHSFLASVHHPHRVHRAFRGSSYSQIHWASFKMLFIFYLLQSSITSIYYPHLAGEQTKIISPRTHG